MKKSLLLTVLLSIVPLSATFSADMNSANWVLDGCRAGAFLTEGERRDQSLDFKIGLCFGGIAGVSYFARVCLPDVIPPRQAARVVVAYLDRNPARLHENFLKLASEAMAEAWPCRK